MVCEAGDRIRVDCMCHISGGRSFTPVAVNSNCGGFLMVRDAWESVQESLELFYSTGCQYECVDIAADKEHHSEVFSRIKARLRRIAAINRGKMLLGAAE